MFRINCNVLKSVNDNIPLVTLTFALAIRSGAVSLGAVVPYLPEMAGLLAGGMLSAFYGAQLVHRLSDRRLVLLIAVLLGALGLLLMTEAFLPLFVLRVSGRRLPDKGQFPKPFAKLLFAGRRPA